MYLLQNRLRPVWTCFLRFFAGPQSLISGTGPDLEALLLTVHHLVLLRTRRTHFVLIINTRLWLSIVLLTVHHLAPLRTSRTHFVVGLTVPALPSSAGLPFSHASYLLSW